jgi:hypothetical protein
MLEDRCWRTDAGGPMLGMRCWRRPESQRHEFELPGSHVE